LYDNGELVYKSNPILRDEILRDGRKTASIPVTTITYDIDDVGEHKMELKAHMKGEFYDPADYWWEETIFIGNEKNDSARYPLKTIITTGDSTARPLLSIVKSKSQESIDKQVVKEVPILRRLQKIVSPVSTDKQVVKEVSKLPQTTVNKDVEKEALVKLFPGLRESVLTDKPKEITKLPKSQDVVKETTKVDKTTTTPHLQPVAWIRGYVSTFLLQKTNR
jgi:hypothetical protein